MEGIEYRELEGVSNADAMNIFGAQSAPTPYSAVPLPRTGQTNSNTELTARSEILSPGSTSRLIFNHPGSEEYARKNIKCANGGSLESGC